jgi:capsular polysaccharide biosynthesis protein
MELRRYITIVRRRLPLVVAVLIAALAAGYLITPKAKTYTASTVLYVGSRSISVDPRSGQVSGDRVIGFDRLIKTFSAMIQSEPAAKAAIDDASVNRSVGTVNGETKAEQVENTNLIRVSVTDTDRATARALANSISDSFVQQVNQFEPRDQPADQVLSVYQRAGLPGAPNSRGLARNMVLAGLLGLVAAGALIALLEYLDISLRSAEDVERQLELPVIGVVPALGNELPASGPAKARSAAPRRPTRASGSPVA